MSPESDHLFQPASLEDLHSQINSMRRRGEHQFLPMQFNRIEKLLNRTAMANTGVQALLMQKSAELIANYWQALQQAQSETEQGLLDHAANNSDSELLAQHRYDTLKRQQRSALKRRHFQQLARHQLRTLTDEISAPTLEELPLDSAQALDDEMLAMEQAAQANQLELPLNSQPGIQKRPLLKAVRRYKQLAQQQKTESMVNRAVIARPENPGPLNPHMLAIKSLTNMRDLSLPYLNRFVSYIETILWLEEHLEEEPLVKEPAKAGKKKK